MSNMLEQAIADAAALREQAIKNAEQSVLDKYSKQIKEAVDQMLEMEDDAPTRADEMIAEAEDEIMQEEEAAMTGSPTDGSSTIEAPAAYDSRPGSEDVYVKMSAMLDNLPFDDNDEIELDFGSLDPEPIDLEQGEEAAEDDMGGLGDLGMGAPEEGGEDALGGDLDLGGDDLGGEDDLDLQLQEVLSMLAEEEESEEALEESMHIDYETELTGEFDVGSPRQKFNADMANILYDEEESESESEDEELMGKVNELHETVSSLTQQNNQLESVLSKLEIHLEETLLSNAKLLYQNRTLSDASLNERQKSKIVEAIANAESPKEAKRLHETLRATVGSTPNSKKGPQSLSESVNRRSNLSSMLNTRQNINESKQSNDPFLEKMQKLAGIKK
jgi:hypothetical protein